MNMLEIAKDGWQALGAGKVVANPAAWKAKQVSVNQVAAALGTLVVLAKAFGYDLHMDNQTELLIAGGVYGAVNWVLTVVTTDKINAMGRATVAGDAGNTTAGGQGPLGASVGGVATDTGASNQVRSVSRSSDPAQDDLRGGP